MSFALVVSLLRAETHRHALETGHFALEDRAAEIAALMRGFLARAVPAS